MRYQFFFQTERKKTLTTVSYDNESQTLYYQSRQALREGIYFLLVLPIMCLLANISDVAST
jgi:hypothetical protein